MAAPSRAQDLDTIPLANRSFANIAYLVPGTEPVEPSDPTKARITAVSFGGSSGLNDVNSVDGADNSDDYIGGFLQNFSPDAIQEFAVQTSQQNADIGRTVGGSVEITTKSGTNVMARRGGFLRARRGAQCALSHRESAAPAQTAVLPAELHRHARRTHREGQALLLRLRSKRSTKTPASPTAPPASRSSTRSPRWPREGLIPGSPFDSGARQCADPVPGLPGRPALRLDAVVPLAVVPARRPGYLHHRQRLRGAGHAALHRRHLAFQLRERGAGPAIHFQSHLAGNLHPGGQRIAFERISQFPTRLRAGLSLQLHLADDFRFRNLRRQPVRHADHRLSHRARSGEIPDPLRRDALHRPPLAQLRRRFHSRAGDERRAAR